MRIFVIGAASLFVAACASNHPAATPSELAFSPGVRQHVVEKGPVISNTRGSEVVCRKEAPTGSHRKVTTCMTRSEAEAVTRNTKESMGRNASLQRTTDRAPNETR